MLLSSQQQKVLADVMRILADPLPEHELRARLGERMPELLGAQFCAGNQLDEEPDNFPPDEQQLLDLVRPAFVAALARCRAVAGHREPARDSESKIGNGDSTARLSLRQREVAHLVTSGLPDKEIARRLGISVTTVRSHLEVIFRKLKVQGRMRVSQRLALDSLR